MSTVRKPEHNLFRRIAPVYGLFYRRQQRMFSSVLDTMQKALDLSIFDTVLDVGCGTGALCSVLNQRGFSVTGVDPVSQMLDVGKRQSENRDIVFVQADAIKGLPFDDNQFDLVIASYVAHGLSATDRSALYTEMDRVAKHMVVIYDYNGNRSLLTSIIEKLEGGDYFRFIRQVDGELTRHFNHLRVFDVGKRAAWYVCTP